MCGLRPIFKIKKTLLPSDITENLHVGIYDDFGKEMYRKLLRVNNGIAYGDFEIDNAFEKGSYHIIAWTNYLRNFEKLEPFQQQIEILGNATDNELKVTTKTELNVYPESGTLISGAFNYIGIHLKNNFGDHKPIIKLLNDNGEVLVSSISISNEGFGKVGFFINEKQSYFFEIQDSKGNLFTVPFDESFGKIGLSIDNSGKKQFLAKLLLSHETLFENSNENYSLAIVQEDTVFIRDWIVKKNQLAVSINRESIPYGVNKAILFDELQKPIAYRMFFNHSDKSNRVAKINVRHRLNTSRDSLGLTFSTVGPQALEYNMSVSVLPLGTKAYNPQNFLTSSFLVKPYVNGQLTYKYEFSDFNGFQNYDLDIKLMIEGWGKYNWEESLINNDTIQFESEKGISVKGRILDADLTEENQVLLITDVSKAINYEQLRSDKTFETHMALYEDDSLAVTLIGNNGVLRKSNLEINIDSTWKENKIDILKYLDKSKQTVNFLNAYSEDDALSFKRKDSFIALDEAAVKAHKWKDNGLKINSAEFEGVKIGDYEVKRYPSVSSYLRKLGFLIGNDMSTGKMVVKSKSVDMFGSPIVVLLFVDGFGRGEDIALNMPLSRVQNILHDSGKKIFITIMLRDDAYVPPENRNKYIRHFIRNGYAKPNEYFNPGYEDCESVVFKKYGALYWESSVVFSKKESTIIKVPIKNQEGVKVFVEGVSEDGTLISMEKEINLKLKVDN
ncbi:hypothetical protein [Maribacter hydrothermalis]|uniref:MG2 domain-containing protein n=1 Tax=Maribacter hydrothermalis TaxID=1836467 RepID=A0A1B7Z9F9_9FLAO|nr:hypothetical protein [Maribacter hydrothermalis]APQ16715.1 hypothetical protein BTR34_04995 [Maribacter hydrothermalis]OBR39368.1 hypothetical protein A9200_17330 [Maribacter hydrothermalis]